MNYYKTALSLFILLSYTQIALAQCSIELSSAQSSCFGDSTGQIILDLENVSFPVLASLNGTSFDLNASPWTINNLPAGTYSASFSDTQGCTGQLEILLEETPVLDALNLNYSLCNQSTTVCDDFEASGGTPPYSMVWDWGPTFSSDQFCFPIENQANFTVVISDAMGCTIERTIQSEQDTQSLSVVHYRSDCNESVASINNNGLFYFNPSWSNGSTYMETVADTFGLYTVTAFDSEGCLHVGSYQHGPLAPTADITPVGCTTSDNSGRIHISYDNYSGQTPTPTMTWTGPNGYSGTGRTVEDLFAGDYYVNISFEGNYCGEYGPFNVGYSDPQLAADITDYKCPDSDMGKIRITPTGGIAPYQYTWSNGSSFSTNLTPGSYSITVTDAGACTATATYEILDLNPFPIVSVTAEIVSSCAGTGHATVEIEGGSGNLMIEWSNGETGTEATNLDFGESWVSVTDTLGCTVSDTINIAPAFNLSFTTEFTSCNQNDGSATVMVPGEVNDPIYAWSNGQSNQTATGLAPGGYSVTVTDSDTGCRVHRNVIVEEDSICFVKISGYVYISEVEQDCDPNNNFDSLYLMKVRLNDDQLTFTDTDGYYEFITDAGEHTVSILPLAGTQEVICNNPILVNASVWGETYGANDFYLKWIPIQDLEIKISKQYARPGFNQQVRVCLMNVGSVPKSGTLTFVHPALQDYLQSSPMEASYDSTNHLVSWEFEDIPPGTIWIYRTTLYTPVDTPLGTPLSYEFYADPIDDDVTPHNNYKACTIEVTGSYDPNDKAVSPMGIGEEGIISMADSILSYTIRFQNTGTDTAFTVVIRDTLNENLEVTSLRPGPASHPYSVTVKDGNTLEFLFENILLPDSVINEPASHGFVIFDAVVRKDVTYGTTIDNRAGIYFDFNPPIITNRVTNSIQMITAVEEIQELDFLIYPNPNDGLLFIHHDQLDAVELTIYDLNGITVLTDLLRGSDAFIDISQLAEGAYIVELKGNKGIGYEKLVKF